ncbi:response regulator transcription factor [Virgisporangium aurantiacum]|uniref:DNA-binding response regulator n=1 Tax=Virgisporangium aurantiacum TaxID=175570 RepID=A0A8J3YYS6_9ACTN|nr:response regulator transcription factor [Virgisporangium aurantiacum]GIJ54164.1 DNA-binding response regulator [Virgisporangium aurantiacum]
MPALPVLLLDDHRVFTDALALSLDAEPDLRCVATAGTLRDGLARAAAIDFAVAVVDLQLPDGDGLDAVTGLLRLRPAARIVVLTAHPRPDLADRALATGAVAFLGKDAPLARILAAVRAATAARPVVDGLVASRVDLTDREFDVLRQLGQGRDASRAAAALGISLHTARDHIKGLLAKLGAHSQLEAVVAAQRLGLITIGTRY